MIEESGLNIVPYDDAASNQNYVTKVYAANPNKIEALDYLNGDGPRPTREAHVHVNMGGLSPPILREYRLGPLPISPSTVLIPVAYRGITDFPYNSKMMDSKDYDAVEPLIQSTFAEIKAEVIDSYGTTYGTDCVEDTCLTWIDTSPLGPLRHWTVWFVFDVDAPYSNPVGLTMSFDVSGVDSSLYKLLLLTYNGYSFTSTESFKNAYNDPTWSDKKIPNRPLLQYVKDSFGLEWSSLKKFPNPLGITDPRNSRTRLNSNLPAPEIREPAGHRYVIEDNHIEYLGWSMFIGHSPLTGLQIFDARFRGDRIAYEIGLSEASAIYSGFNDIAAASTVYLDSAWGLGSSAAQLILGVDCPATSTLMDITFLEDSGLPTVKKNSICVFESDEQIPLRKHVFQDDLPYNAYGGLGRTSLIVRVSLPVYNYDYIIDYVFYPNGVIELRAVTSGYLQSTFTSPKLANEARGFCPSVQGHVAGILHDHFFSFKLDLDILRSNNRFQKTEIVAVRVDPQDLDGKLYSDTLSNFEVQKDDYTTKKMQETVLSTEAGLTILPSTPVSMKVLAGTDTNKWGKLRGYKIVQHGVSQNIVSGTKATRALSFSKHSLIVTKRHENEPRITSIYDQPDTTGTLFGGSPLVDADRFLSDAESIDNEDIVVWPMLGVHHIPHSEDIPVTHTLGSAKSIQIVPVNMFDYDDSMDLGNSVFSDRRCEVLEEEDLNFKSAARAKPTPTPTARIKQPTVRPTKRAPTVSPTKAVCSYVFDLLESNVCPMTYDPVGSNLI
jgi:diamine oxidase